MHTHANTFAISSHCAYEVLSKMSGTGAASCWTHYLWTNVTITLEVVPIHTSTLVPVLLPLVKHFMEVLCLRVFSTASDASQIVSIEYRTGSLSTWICVGNSVKLQGAECGEYGGWGTTTMLFFAKKVLVSKDVWQGALLWCRSQFPRRQSSGRRCRTFSRSCQKSHSSILWFGGMNSLCTIPLV